MNSEPDKNLSLVFGAIILAIGYGAYLNGHQVGGVACLIISLFIYAIATD